MERKIVIYLIESIITTDSDTSTSSSKLSYSSTEDSYSPTDDEDKINDAMFFPLIK